ncbi:hypothetical protein AVEN_117625-1 [Araneus ventricosus]|uniref:Uncharacterized protein n=1 Tax=Araneus ventricosus TaxID=182803 RepID=A0A4Y2QYW6_ARAVE|nr:hypothetical protein AVEN_117625-1 [Araneus ventricosus]
MTPLRIPTYVLGRPGVPLSRGSQALPESVNSSPNYHTIPEGEGLTKTDLTCAMSAYMTDLYSTSYPQLQKPNFYFRAKPQWSGG